MMFFLSIKFKAVLLVRDVLVDGIVHRFFPVNVGKEFSEVNAERGGNKQ
jgi:hypothetical protein